jgi:hypothetical protein
MSLIQNLVIVQDNMAYIPKNKIQINLYTSGGEYALLSSGQIYIGYYHKLYNGKYFTGKTPNDSNIKELVALRTEDNGIDDLKFFSLSIPYNPLLPTEQDYQVGEFIRYFNIKRNQAIFTEITKETYDKFQKQDPQVPWRSYRVFSLSWQLTGDINQVAQTNKNITELTESRERVFGLGLYLKENWTQYYKNPSQK